MTEILARCHPALEPILPKPVPARAALPPWLAAMPAEVAADSLGGARVRTLKHCPPFIDALSLGLLIPLAADIEVAEGELRWDWAPPVLPDALLPRAPVGLHVGEQAAGAPLPMAAGIVVKFLNFWTLEAPPGWSILFTHPFGREDLPFRTLAGLVDCDAFGAGHVHFPALWVDGGFTGRLPAGTPVAQAIPLPRGAVTVETRAQTAAEAAGTRALQEALAARPGHYRRSLRGGSGSSD